MPTPINFAGSPTPEQNTKQGIQRHNDLPPMVGVMLCEQAVDDSVVGRCPACGIARHQPIRPYRSHSSIFVSMQLTRCLQCDLVFAVPTPTDKQLRAYNLSYFDNAHGGYKCIQMRSSNR